MAHPTVRHRGFRNGDGKQAKFHGSRALEQRRDGPKTRGEVPIGAVLVHEGEVMARADGNRTIAEFNDPTAHAEILVIRRRLQRAWAVSVCRTAISMSRLSPVPMCAAAISFARIRRLYYGAADHQGRRRRQAVPCLYHPDRSAIMHRTSIRASMSGRVLNF